MRNVFWTIIHFFGTIHIKWVMFFMLCLVMLVALLGDRIVSFVLAGILALVVLSVEEDA